MTPQCRLAVASDAAECIRIRGLTRENAVSEERLRNLGITAESLTRDIDNESFAGYVCHANGRLIGFCFGATETGEIVVLALLPEYENRGLGRRLISSIVEQLRTGGHRRLFLSCSSDPSCRAYGFYRHLGWTSTGTFDRLGDEVLELLGG